MDSPQMKPEQDTPVRLFRQDSNPCQTEGEYIKYLQEQLVLIFGNLTKEK